MWGHDTNWKEKIWYLSLQIAEAYRRKIEAIVRKPSGAGRGGEEEEQELLSPCPHCGCRSPATSLDCSQCLGRIPYCIVTGMRMVTHDWTICPSCRFPALYSKFLSVITAEKVSFAHSKWLTDSGWACTMLFENLLVGSILLVQLSCCLTCWSRSVQCASKKLFRPPSYRSALN